ncbi:MAG: endolytic transglycosylase MltG [Lachnospiraceae bacterium]|nr:endolytic transglycosylase MltG [Lachnospiraceae bacterium]MBR4058233.1 endolytic transglycosylase MltG [Lachnospiraceae bacterium]
MKKQKSAYSALFRITKLLLAVVIVMIVYVGALTAYDFGYRIFAEKPVTQAPGQEVVVTIEEGMGTGAVAEMLEAQGVIRDALVFKIQNKLSHYSSGFRAGTYTLNTSMENDDIMAVLSGEISQE